MMENNNRPKPISVATISFAIATVILGGLSGYLIYKNTELENKEEKPESAIISGENYHIKKVGDEIYYIIDGDYDGEYDIQYTNLSRFNIDHDDEFDDEENEDDNRNDIQYINYCSYEADEFNVREIMDYDDYQSFIKKWGLKQKYYEQYSNYAVFSYYVNSAHGLKARLANIEEWGNEVTLFVWDDVEDYSGDCAGYVIVVPTFHNDGHEMNIVPLYSAEDVIEPIIITPHPTEPIYTLDKPMIYLYPESEQSVEVKLDSPEKLTVSYPAYVGAWNVVAKPDGTLRDKNGRELYGLYYESLPKTEFKISDTGFIVRRENAAEFLEEKLALLGLNEREAEEFIVYWLPKMNEKEYTYVRFATEDEINANMKLSISPEPDTTIRVWMVMKSLDEPIEVREQKINPITRSGFTAVEWGGIKL